MDSALAHSLISEQRMGTRVSIKSDNEKPKSVARSPARSGEPHSSERHADPHEVWLWRVKQRVSLLSSFASDATQLSWSPALMQLLIQELHAEDAVRDLIGDPATVPRARYPQLVAVAIAFRHSWRPEDLRRTLRRLRTANKPRCQ